MAIYQRFYNPFLFLRNSINVVKAIYHSGLYPWPERDHWRILRLLQPEPFQYLLHSDYWSKGQRINSFTPMQIELIAHLGTLAKTGLDQVILRWKTNRKTNQRYRQDWEIDKAS